MKQMIGNYLLNRKLLKLKQTKAFNGINKAKSIGILFDATKYDSYKAVKSLVKELTANNKNVKALGYVNNKKMDDQYLSDKIWQFVCKKDFNWINQPTDSSVDSFANESFDILIVLAVDPYFPIRYISSLSKSLFRVGLNGVENSIFDMVLQVKPNESMEHHISVTMQYLKMISNQKEPELELA